MATTKKAAAKAKELMVSEKFSNRIRVVCMECGKKFQTVKTCPVCPKCNSSDIEVADNITAPKAKAVKPAVEVTPKKVIRVSVNPDKIGYKVEDIGAGGKVVATTAHNWPADKSEKIESLSNTINDILAAPADVVTAKELSTAIKTNPDETLDVLCARIAAANKLAHTPA